MTGRRTNILLTCSGRKEYLADIFSRSRQLGRLVAVDSAPDASMQFRAPLFRTVPSIDAPDYVDAVLAICVEQGIDCVIPQNDLDLVVLAEAEPRFVEAGVILLGAPADVTCAVRDKLTLGTWMAANRLPYPSTWRPRSVPSGNVPLIAKSRLGQGSAALELLTDLQAVERLDDDAVVVQQLIQGKEFNLDILRRADGVVVSVVSKEKLEMRFGSTHKARSVNDPMLLELGEAIGAATRHVGAIDVDVMVDATGAPWVLDINPRVGGGFGFTALFCPRYVDALLEIGRRESPAPFIGEYPVGRRADRGFSYFLADA